MRVDWRACIATSPSPVVLCMFETLNVARNEQKYVALIEEHAASLGKDVESVALTLNSEVVHSNKKVSAKSQELIEKNQKLQQQKELGECKKKLDMVKGSLSELEKLISYEIDYFHTLIYFFFCFFF